MLLASFAAMVGLAVSAPFEVRDGRPPNNFILQSKVKANSPKDLGSNKTDLYLISYHTGAGLGAATFEANQTVAPVGSLNATGDIYQVQFKLGDYEWPLAVTNGPYQTFESATISIDGDRDNFGFYFTDNGLQWNNTEFVGWLACDFWFNESPSLFAQVTGNRQVTLPVSYSEIDLVAVAA